MLVEDAQYADAGLLDFLDYLVDWVRDLPVYVLVLARPELGQARPGFGAGRNRSTLTLDPLDAASMDVLVDALVRACRPGAGEDHRPGAGHPAVRGGNRRALIDRDIVQPIEGVYRLTGDVGQLAVPDSLHALLAARLDALDPEVRRLVADAAVLGTTFPAEALIAVSGQDEAMVRAALAELVRREVLTVSADPLSPERGSYGFAQNMLRQVAYDTLSRRDRKARHLKVAAHLRAAFHGDGEEVADVIAQHYLDALEAVPDDPDAGEIRGQAIAALTQAAERAERTGPPPRAAASYAAAAQLTQAGTPTGGQPPPRCGSTPPRPPTPMPIRPWRSSRPARPGSCTGRAAIPARPPVPRRSPGRRCACGAGTPRRASSSPPPSRCCGQTPTPTPSRPWANWRCWRCSPAHPPRMRCPPRRWPWARPWPWTRPPWPACSTPAGSTTPSPGEGRRRPPISGRPPGWPSQAGDTAGLGRALLNLSDTVAGTDPAAGAEAARAAAAHSRQAGARNHLATAVMNLAQALLMTGDWDAAEAELAQAADADGLADIGYLACYRAWVAALRGDTPTAQATLAGLGDLRASEDPQDQATIAVAEAFTAAARCQPAAALRHARAALDHATALGISHEYLRWAWPLAARAAHDLADTATTGDLLALLDGYQPGQLAPMQRAERDLARARLAAGEAARPPARRSPPRSPGCASTPPPTTWPTACSTTPPTCRPRRCRGRRGRDQRSPRYRPAAGLPAAARPRGHHPARHPPRRGLMTTASASPGPARRREPGHFPQRPAPLGNATPRSRYAATPGPRPASNPTQRRQPQTREAYS